MLLRYIQIKKDDVSDLEILTKRGTRTLDCLISHIEERVKGISILLVYKRDNLEDLKIN